MFYIVLLLTAIWIVLSESFTVSTALIGLVISVASVFFCRRLLPFSKIENINYFRLAIYPFYLLGQVYLSAFNVMRLIFTGADVEIVKVKTRISNVFLRAILANSITLAPGTVSLELKDDTITVLRLKEKTDNSKAVKSADESIKGNLEKMLIKAEM